MYWKSERHHTLWAKREYNTSLEKRVRQMSALILHIPYPNHRLIHASMEPPEKPDTETLAHMRELAFDGLYAVMNNLDHPIVEHLDKQMRIIGMDANVAMDKIEARDYQR